MALGDYIKTTYINGSAPGISAERLNRNEDKTAELDTAVAAHMSDYTLQVPFVVCTGLANTYTAVLNPAPPSLAVGLALCVKINAANTGASTININGLGAKAILDSKGNVITAGKLRLNGVYTLRYDGSSFILQGEGSDYAKPQNLCINGGFENDLNCWTKQTDMNVINGSMYLGSKSITTVSGVTNSYVYQYIYLPSSSNKLYVTAMFYPNTYTSGTKPTLSVYEGSGWNYSLAQIKTVDTSKLKTWQRLSTIANGGPSEAMCIRLGRVGTGVENTLIDCVMAIDLTAAYGAGNEPTIEEMDALVTLNSGWWDSNLYYYTKDAYASGADITSGVTAYAKGMKILGTSTNKKWVNGSTAINTSITTTTKVTFTLPFTPSYVMAYLVTDASYNGSGIYANGTGYYLSNAWSSPFSLGYLYVYYMNVNGSALTVEICRDGVVHTGTLHYVAFS